MKKQLLNILTSPLYCVAVALSIIIMLGWFLNYQEQPSNYYSSYSIQYHENIEEYDSNISQLEDNITNLDPKSKNYEENIARLQNYIKIYKALKENNVDFSKVYDEGYGNMLDRNIYSEASVSIITIILLINAMIIVYLAFTNEFDNARYSLIYSNVRYKTILTKLLASFIALATAFLIIILLNVFYSSLFEKKFEYALVLSNDSARFISIDEYMFNANYLTLFYISIFLLALFWSIALFVKKTSIFIWSVVGVVAIVVALAIFRIPVFTILGIGIDLTKVSYDFINVARLSILIPISLFVGSLSYFEKCDLK